MMMKRMKRMTGLTLLTALAIVLAAGCAGNGGNVGGSATQSPSGDAGATAAPTEQPPMEISWLSFDFPAEDGTAGQRYIEEKFNVKLKNFRIDRANWKDQLNVRLASGELPDVWLLWGITDVSAYSGQQLLAELPIDEIKQNMPTLAKLVDDNDPLTWVNGLIDGKNYGIPITNIDGIYPLLPVYNENWLQAIGYDQAPTTLAEFEDVMYKFRNNDPDQNGKKDTYGLTGRAANNINLSFPFVFSAFDVLPQFWVKDDAGGVAYGMNTENAREAFKVLNKWFKDGVIDPEFITADGKRNEFENGIVGHKFDQWNLQRPTLRAQQQQQADSGFFPTVVGAPVAAPGHTGMALGWGLTGNYMGMSVDVDQTPGKREKIYEILNATYSDPEVMKYLNFGEEGVHHELANGLPVLKPDVTADKLKNDGIGAYYGILSGKSLDSETLRFPAEDLEWRKHTVDGVPLLLNQVKFNIPSANQFPDISNLEREYFIKFITGEADLEGGFDSYIDKWNKAGGEILTKEVNEIYAANTQ